MSEPMSGSPGPLLIQPVRHHDARGWFSETFSAARLAAAGVTCGFPQDNQSWSAAAGTVRGLHFQRPPSAQAKLVACLQGRISDCIVDLRAGSPTYGHCLQVELGDTGEQLFVPVGFAHGFVTLTPETIVSYKVSHPYDPAAEGGLAWNDPMLKLDWPLPPSGAVVSEKDAALGLLSSIESPFAYTGGPMTLTRV